MHESAPPGEQVNISIFISIGMRSLQPVCAVNAMYHRVINQL